MRRVVVSRHLVPRGYGAITLYPFIFVPSERRAKDIVLINHERIHLRQQWELFIIGFFIWYGIDFLIKFCKYRNWKKAYRDIIFEREAYTKQEDLDYLDNRKRFAFMKF